jgi:hypothetical protein
MGKRAEIFRKAREEGRICSNCGWIITKELAKKGSKLCGGCTSALKGVNVKQGALPYQDEPRDRTGES